MPPSDFSSERKSEAHSLRLCRLEHLKQMVGDFRRDARSIVVDSKNGLLAFSVDPDDDLPLSIPPLRSRVDRIGHEIVERLLDGDSVGSDRGRGGRRLYREGDAPRKRFISIQRCYLPGDLADVGRLQLQFPTRNEVPDSFDDAPRLLRLRISLCQNARDGGNRLAAVEHATRAVDIGRQRRKRLADFMGESDGHPRRRRVCRHPGQFQLLLSQQLRRLLPFRNDRTKQLPRRRQNEHQSLKYVEITVGDLKMRERGDQRQLRYEQRHGHGSIAVVYADPKNRKKKQVEQISVPRVAGAEQDERYDAQADDQRGRQMLAQGPLPPTPIRNDIMNRRRGGQDDYHSDGVSDPKITRGVVNLRRGDRTGKIQHSAV